MAKPRSHLAALRKTLRALQEDFEEAARDPELVTNRGPLARSMALLSAEIRRAELHEAKLHPEAKTPEEHEARIRHHFELLPKPRQVEVAKALGMIAGDGTLLGR